LHLFYECNHVHDILVNIFKTITNDNDFAFSKREFFTNFERRGFATAKNMSLTICAKLVIKYIWECRNRSCVPSYDNCLDYLRDRLLMSTKNSNKFNNVWTISGLFDLNNAINNP
jgi:hypothetical protein